MTGLYWSTDGDWFRTDPRSEAGDFLGGPPRSAEAIRLDVGSAGGFVSEGRLGRRSPLPLTAVVHCCHGSPGEDGTLQSLFDLAGVRSTGPTAAGAALGMDKLAFGAVIESAGLPTLPRVALGADGAVPEDVGAQAEICFANIDAILRAGGASRADVVRINAFVTDRAHMADYMAARDAWLAEVTRLPASTLVIVSGFTREEFKVEIEVVAAVAG